MWTHFDRQYFIVKEFQMLFCDLIQKRNNSELQLSVVNKADKK